MKLLAFECSAAAASAAVCDGETLLGESYVNIRQTHSRTLLPVAEGLLRSVGLAPAQMDAFAVTVGPGSFTGVRIGIAAVKGMAFALEKPCVGLSTLEALAWNLRGAQGLIVPAMDARCGQVYAAVFRGAAAGPERLTEDLALPIAQLAERLKAMDEPAWLVGDGAALCYDALSSALPVRLAPPERRFQRASSVAELALARMETALPADQLRPAYLRLPQAERERLARSGGEPNRAFPL